jgi:four helix bundle protein
VKEFTELKVWQDGKALTVSIYKITEAFPRKEMFGMTDQLRRAANSVCANIAEGFERYHTKDKIKFYYNARGSISECKSHLLVSQELNYLGKDKADELVCRFNRVGYLLNNMISALSRAAASRSE